MSNELERLRKIAAENIRYERQLSRLHSTGKETSCIDQTITRALENITSIKARSFVIYGEPQSGKTEMMICLTAKLIDSGFNLIVHLLNDSVQLLQQNLERFQRSGSFALRKELLRSNGPRSFPQGRPTCHFSQKEHARPSKAYGKACHRKIQGHYR